MIDFIKWCFRSEDSGIATVVILGMIFTFAINIVKIIKKN